MSEKSWKIIPDSLCTRCGTCEGVCPEGIIVEDSNGFPFGSDKDKCSGCELCKKVCPGKHIDFPLIIDKGDYSYHPCLGYYLSVKSAICSDSDYALNSASGGAVTSLLKYLFESKAIDAVFTVRMNREYPFNAYPFLARRVEELEEGRQSKYQPVMVNSLLRDIGECSNVAVVGLPCHIHGIRNAEQEIQALKKKIFLHIGLFCGFNMEKDATGFLIRKMGMQKFPVKKIQYRAGKWPGGFLVEDSRGRRRFTRKEDYSLLNYLYLPQRCSTCPDYSAEMSDISFGDAWYKKGSEGWNAVIVRNERAEKFLDGASLTVEDADAQMIVDSHKFVIDFKKRGALKRIHLSGEKYPTFTNYPESLEKADLLPFDKMFLLLYRCRFFLAQIFKFLPFFVFRMTSRILRRKKIG